MEYLRRILSSRDNYDIHIVRNGKTTEILNCYVTLVCV